MIHTVRRIYLEDGGSNSIDKRISLGDNVASKNKRLLLHRDMLRHYRRPYMVILGIIVP